LHVSGKEECLVSISQIVHPMDIHPINIHLSNEHLMNIYPTWMSQIWPSSQLITMIHWAHLITSYFIHNYLFRFTSCLVIVIVHEILWFCALTLDILCCTQRGIQWQYWLDLVLTTNLYCRFFKTLYMLHLFLTSTVHKALLFNFPYVFTRI
jgi:hypothetical protein